MNRLAFQFSAVAAFAIVACTISVSAFAGGNSNSCHQCGCGKQVKQICRLVMVREYVDIPSYVYAKEEVFYPDKGSVRYTGYRSDTFYDFWRDCDCSQVGDASQHGLSQLNCRSFTVCGCKTLYGAKPTGCHLRCGVRVPDKTQRVATPILKWETVALCKDCCQNSGKKK